MLHGRKNKKKRYREEHNIMVKEVLGVNKIIKHGSKKYCVGGQERPKDYACCSKKILCRQERTLLAGKGDSAAAR